jgi:hypothetical protein
MVSGKFQPYKIISSDDTKHLIMYQSYQQTYSDFALNSSDAKFYLTKWSPSSKIVLTRTLINKPPSFLNTINPVKFPRFGSDPAIEVFEFFTLSDPITSVDGKL